MCLLPIVLGIFPRASPSYQQAPQTLAAPPHVALGVRERTDGIWASPGLVPRSGAGLIETAVAAGEDRTPALYSSAGIRPEAVRQGTLGSCYFYATLAALANVDPDMIRRTIQDNADGTYTVRFGDSKTEKAYSEDLRFARESGFDRSDGLWVGVLFRAYAQRVLRGGLIKALNESSLFSFAKTYAIDFMSSNDVLLLAYDRSIRAVVDQSGHLDRAKLETKLKDQMRPIKVSDQIKDSLVQQLDSRGFFDTIAETVKKNGELFGAYRAAGQGGIPGDAMESLLGTSAPYQPNGSEEHTASELTRAASSRRPVVAATRAQTADALVSDGRLPSGSGHWYVQRHAYTVLGYDPATHTVTLRNPWGTYPDPNGVFSVSLTTFLAAFEGFWITSQ